jgi:YD repeat-containing protein
MDDRSKAGLRGPVSVCRLDESMFISDCTGNRCDTEPKEQTHWTITRYHLDGRIAQCHRNRRDGSEWTTTYTYDATGKLREIETREATGSVSKTTLHYDQGGRLHRVTGREGGGAENILQTFTYDEQHKTKTQYFHSMPGRAGSVALCYSVEGADAAYSARGATSMTTVYDDQGRSMETLFHDSQQRVLSRVTLRYDDDGHVVEESQTTEMEEILPPEMHPRLNAAQLQSVKAIFGLEAGAQRSKQLHRYDTEGHRVETVLHVGTFGVEWKIMDYNQQGDLSEEKSVHDSKPPSIDDQGRVVEPSRPSAPKTPNSEARFSYQYDEHGNWTERVVSTR